VFRHALMTMAMLSVELCCGAWQRAAQAQSFPNRPLTIHPGGTTDAIARILAEGLRTELGRPVIFENVGEGAASPAPAGSPKQHADGYQFVLGSLGTRAQSQSFYKKPLDNAATDFLPVVPVADEPIVLVARKDFPSDNLRRFIAYAKVNRAKLQYAAGAGGSNQLACLCSTP
jgi:tripartite-type tricarboxylate transporter receptor subunit TctC